MVSHLRNVHIEVIGHEAKNGEDDEACVDTCGTVGDADDDAVPVERGRAIYVLRHSGKEREKSLVGSLEAGLPCRISTGLIH